MKKLTKKISVLKFLFSSKYALWTFGLLLVQQLIVASSTFWLARFAVAAVSGAGFLRYGAFYGLSLLLPYLPGILSLTCVSLWDLDLHKNFLDRFVGKHEGQISLWRNHSERGQRTSVLSKEGPQALQDAVNYFYDFFSTGLNVVLNTLAISFVVHPVFAAAYGISLATCAVVIWKTRQHNEKLSVAAQDSSVRFTSVMLRIWDNVLLANPFNIREWQKNANRSFQTVRSSRLKAVGFSQLISGFTTLLTMMPMAAAVIWFLVSHRGNTAAVSGLLVTLPRLFMILNFTFHLLSLALNWISNGARVRAVLTGIEDFSQLKGDLNSQINFDKIVVETSEHSIDNTNLAHLKELFKRPGRFTIRGQNGAGKTALLLKLKEELSEVATYIPANHDLDVGTGEPAQNQSTGQRARMVMGEIFRRDLSPVILLDEWDANLDAANRHNMSEWIDRESQKRCVVEVVHAR